MNKQLPNNANLDHLKAQAKDLLRQLKATSPAIQLSAAQHQLANEYGFVSWPKLVAHLKETELGRASLDKARQIVENGIRDGQYATDARKILGLYPQVSKASLACSLVALDLDAARTWLDQATVNEPIGDLKAHPAVYCSFSPLAESKPQDFMAMLTWLIEIGANPNAAFDNPDFPDNPLSILYSACGRLRSPQATRLLLDHGADPNDNESVYHSTESSDHTCLKKILEGGGRIDGTNALGHMLDREDLEGLNLMLSFKPALDSGVLIHAMRRGRSQAILDRLVEAGADPSQPDSHGITAYQVAFERGIDLGAKDFEPSDADRLLAACWRGDTAEADQYRAAYSSLPDYRRKAFTDACWQGRADTVEAFLAGGFSLTERDDSKGTPLHCASFAGSLATVQALLRHNPPLDDNTDMYQAAPIQWAAFSSQFNNYPDHPGIVKALIDAGAAPPNRIFGREEVKAVLREKWPDLEEDL